MGDIVLAGATSGTCTLHPADVSGTTTLTLPTANGTVLTSASSQNSFPPNIAGNGPIFSYNTTGAGQTLNTATWTKLTFTLQVFDTTSGMYSSSRFTPTVAGYYQINAVATYSNATAGKNAQVAIYKNGSYAYGAITGLSSTDWVAPNTAGLIYLNGSTDYVEIYAYQNVGSSQTLVSGYSWFQGVLVRAA